MIKNSIKIAWRNIRKNRGFSILNMTGLAIGITCFLLLGAYIIQETRYDRFLPHADRVAYISFSYKSPNEREFEFSSTTPTAIAPILEKEFAEVEKAVRVYHYNAEGLVQNGNEHIKETALRYADEGFFDVIAYPFLTGDAKTALREPYQIVLTQALADKYFPSKPAIGETLIIDGQPWKVSGIVPTPPSYTQIQFSAVLSNKHLARYRDPVWHSANDVTFAMLKNEQDFKALAQKANDYVQQQLSDLRNSGFEVQLQVEKLTDVHLHSKAGSGNMLYVYIFGALAIAIVIIACVNFTNLSLAHSAERGKEIGVKKVLGASKRALFYNFLVECSLMVCIAIAVALALAYFLLPVFANYIGTIIELNIPSLAGFCIGILIFAVLISLLAGGWPALVISAFKPTQTLKGKAFSMKQGLSVGSAFIVLQFSISILFIICTLVAMRQLHYIQTKNTGLERAQIVVLDGDVLSDADRTTLKTKLLTQGNIAGVTASYDSPVNIQGGYTINKAEGKSADFNLSVTAIPVEKDFISVFGVPILAGAPLTDTDILRARDTTDAREYSFIVNQQMISALQWTPEEALGKFIDLNGRKGRIKTVVQDFNFASLKEEIKPVVLFPEYYYFGNIFVKVGKQQDMVASLAQIEQVWKEVKPNAPFDYHFLDEDFAALYRHEQQTSKTMFLFSIITIGVACMGLFALATFQGQKRIKEIGIRKVLGASVGKIILMLTSDFMKLVAIAILIAAPIGWWVMHNWLLNFAYRITIEWWVFVVAGLMAIAITLLTIGGQALRAARANPVDSLRDE